MRRKGFTLVELLAVITLLALLIGITIPLVTKVKDKMNKKNYETKIKLYEDTAKLWFKNNAYCYNNETESESCKIINNLNFESCIADEYGSYKCSISLSSLAENNIISYDEYDSSGNGIIIDPKTGDDMQTYTIDVLINTKNNPME